MDAKTMTLVEAKKQKHAIYAERVSKAICIHCGEAPAGYNQNGQRSKSCEPCKQEWMANRVNSHRNETSKAQITAYRPPRIRLSSDEIDELHEKRRDAAGRKVLPFIKAEKQVTVGAIKRQFPEYERIIWSVLKNLKIEGKIIYDEHAAAPTIVRCGSMTRVTPKLQGYNNKATFAPASDKSLPDPQSLYGADTRGYFNETDIENTTHIDQPISVSAYRYRGRWAGVVRKGDCS